MPAYRTLAAPVTREIPRIRGSRFVAVAAPTRSPEEAEARVEAARRRWPDATHHCFAWRLAPDGARHRASDDGEPARTAGEPILRQLEARDLLDAVVVVARWFGGTKLGTGGLVRAYSAAAAAALDAAEVVLVPLRESLVVECAWADVGAVRGAIRAAGAEVTAEAHGEGVRLEVAVPVEAADGLVAALGDRTSGRARVWRGAAVRPPP